MSEFRAYYLGNLIKLVDCNECAYLNMTEDEQEYEYEGKYIHKCLFYDERVFHRTNNLIHNTRLYPCDKCYKDDHKNFSNRINLRENNDEKFE